VPKTKLCFKTKLHSRTHLPLPQAELTSLLYSTKPAFLTLSRVLATVLQLHVLYCCYVLLVLSVYRLLNLAPSFGSLRVACEKKHATCSQQSYNHQESNKNCNKQSQETMVVSYTRTTVIVRECSLCRTTSSRFVSSSFFV
jgi:hypothetical protein